ncbi:MAG TPA: amino acid permease [Prolixibacteraceae bacterium]|nr:amino acid permease [Prolixibacteraceae bacterium]
MAKAKKFGAFGGVFTPSILTLLGVIMYLRLPWIVGQAGLWATLGIILVAHIISGSTGLSVASIATDKKVETGGTYYIISRSLGLPIGGTLGWALFVGLSFSVSLYLIGFAEVFLGYFGFEVSINAIRIAGSIILLLVTILTFISTSLAIKTQYIILTIMALSLLSVFFGKHEYTPVVPQLGAIPTSLPWITLFAIFFPAVTGFEAGVSMSGDLKDARKNIPFGTIAAILVGLIVYVGLAFFLSYTVNNDLLVNDPEVLFKISWIPQLVIAGILGATLSSALGSIMGAPRIMQAVAKDGIAPFFFSKGYGASNEPRNALLLTFIIAEGGILIGDLNVIARIVTIFFIITYGFLNITYTVESWASSDFRPSFKIPRIVSMIGATACIIVMIELDIMALAVASVILVGLFFYLKNKELKLHSGDTLSSIWLSLVKTGLLKLAKTQMNTRNWRPNVILFSGGTSNRPHLIEIGKALVGKLGIFTNFELIETPDENLLFDKTARVSVETFGEHTNIITRRHNCRNVYEGMGMISRIYGFSGFEPNTILMGWSKNTSAPKKWEDLLLTLHKLDYNLAFLNYDKIRGFGNHKRIDFWWSGSGRNLSLALHLIRYITVTPKWRHAEIRILASNPDSKNTDRYYAILGQMIDSYRIRASIKVINNSGKLPENELIRSESQDTDLTIAEIQNFATHKVENMVGSANELIKSLKSCLLIHASSGFDEVNVISKSPYPEKAKSSDPADKKPVESILKNIQLSKTELVFNTVYNLAQILEKQALSLIDSTFFAITKSRNTYLDQTASLTDNAMRKLVKANDIGNQQEKHWEQLKILNDFSFQAQKELATFKEIFLKEEQEILKRGITRFTTETGNLVYELPEHIRLMLSRDDYRKLKPTNLYRRINRILKIGWMSISGKKISTKVNLQPAAGYFLYYKRLDYLRQFYENYAVQSLSAFPGIKELLNSTRETIEKALSGKLATDELVAKKEINAAKLVKLRTDNQNFVDNQGQQMLTELTDDLEKFSQMIESPQANLLSRKLKAFQKKKLVLENSLAEFPELWFHFRINQVNKTYLDAIYFSLKNRLTTKIEKTVQDIEFIIEGDIHKKLMVFESQIQSILERSDLKSDKKDIFSQKSISFPQIEVLFNTLSKDIQEAVERLPESIEITGNELQENITLEQLENVTEFVVSVRKTADFYLSNELIDQIRKQSGSIGQQLTLSISSLKNLIRLANFHFENRETIHPEDPENEKIKEQQKTLLENIVRNIKTEEQKLKTLYEQLRQSFATGLKNAFEPLSSAIIIKSAGDLKEKIRTTDQRRLFSRLHQFEKSVRKTVINQLVKLLYRESKGLLWANRMKQLQERNLLFPGEPVARMLEKISPNKALIQKLPFYYSNLFSGSSTIGEDFWVGMEHEIEKGGKAIKRFVNGTSGLLIISGGRSSGKSSLSKHLANLHFEKQNIFNIRAPRESIADVGLFEQTLLESLDGHESLPYCMEALPPKSVIVINDLELWWERKPFGTQVIEKIISLMRQYGHKVLFIINVNQYALKIINQLSSINTWALDLVFCQPFDASELKDLVMLRHQAGGMKLILDKKHEKDMSDWEYARLFNRFFKLSEGNPGHTINLWLAGIRKISGNTLFMERPFSKEITFQEDLPQNEIFYILQFVLHRRFSVKRLSEILQNDVENTEKTVRILLQKGILTEKFQEVYCLNPALEIHLVKKLKSLELL